MTKMMKIFVRIFKYPIFALSDVRKEGYKVTITLDNSSTIQVTAFETVNQHDRDFLLVLLYYMQMAEKKAKTTVTVDEYGISTIRACFPICRISEELNNHTYDYFDACLKRLTSLTIFYSDRSMEKPMRFLHFYDISKEEIKTVEVHLDYEFFRACNWDIDLSNLLKLKSNTAKALLGVLSTNSNIRKEATLIERTGIKCQRPDVARKMLVQAFTALEKNKLTPQYVRIKKGRGEYDYIPIVSSAPGEYFPP